MHVSLQARFYTLLDQDLNAINHTAGKDLWRASTQMCPFKHLLISQLWANQSPTGWSTGDGKSHLHRDVKTHSATTKINNQTPRTKAQCIPASLPAIPAHQESSCLGEQMHRPRKQAPCACARTTKTYTMQWDWRPTQTIHTQPQVCHIFLILCKYFALLWSVWNVKLERKEGR